MTKEARRTHPESVLNTLAPAEEDVTGRTAFDAAAQGDAAGREVVDTYTHYLAVGVANIINIFFPEVVGLSGGVANQGEKLLEPLRAAVEPMIFGHEFAKKHTLHHDLHAGATAQGSSAQRCWQKVRQTERYMVPKERSTGLNTG